MMTSATMALTRLKHGLFRASLVASLYALGCQPAHSPQMRAGEDCQRCHDGNDARAWTISGTLYDSPTPPQKGVADAEILVRDSAGRSMTLRTNGVGNFYTAEAISFPVTVEAQKNGKRFGMNDTPHEGNCNSCHSVPGLDDALGHVFVTP